MVRIVIVLLIIILALDVAKAQCPTNEADLANGGTFSGNCNVNVGGSITITGNVIWTSGTLSINGNNGDLNVQGSLTVQNGATVRIDDGNDGDIDVENGGSIIVEIGGTLFAREEIQIQNGGSMTVAGTVYSETQVIDIDAGGYVQVTATGSLSTGGNDDILVQGTLEVYGFITAGDDLTVSGGTVTLYNGAVVDLADDFFANNNSNITIETGASVTLNDEFFIDDSNVSIAGSVVSSSNDDINISGTSNVTFEEGADVQFNDMEMGTGDGQTTVTVNGGTISLAGEIDFNSGVDGDAIVINGGVVNVGNDLEIGVTDGTITVNSGGVLNTPSVDGVAVTDTNDLPSNIIISGGDVNVNGIPLPVELLSFISEVNGNFINLTWITAQEVENDRFILEKSTDGFRFTILETLKGAGTTNDQTTYTFSDLISGFQKVYYRLTQVDRDDTKTTYPVISVQIDHQDILPVSSFEMYPNPLITDDLTIELRDQFEIEPIRLSILDLSGKELFSNEYVAGTRLINLHQLKSKIGKGRYLLMINSNHNSQSKTILID